MERDMKRHARILSVALLLLTPALGAVAQEYKAGSIEIQHPAAKATLPGQPVGGGFFTLVNHGAETFLVERGARIAQLVVAPVSQVNWTERGELENTDREAGGFGSTGLAAVR